MFSAQGFNGICSSALLPPTLPYSDGQGLPEETTIACVKMTVVYMTRKTKRLINEVQSPFRTGRGQT